MDNSLTTVNGKPRRVLRIGGETHEIWPLTIDDWTKLQTWVNSQFPDPFDIVQAQIDKGRYTITQQKHLYALAMEQAAKGERKIGTPDADEKLQGLDGIMELLYVSIAKGEPAFTREDAARLAKAMTPNDIARMFAETGADMVLSDPKSPAPSANGKTTTESASPAGNPTVS